MYILIAYLFALSLLVLLLIKSLLDYNKSRFINAKKGKK